MKFVLDSCTVLNLINGGALLPLVHSHIEEFILTQAVYDECPTCRDVLDLLIAQGCICLNDVEIPLEEYKKVLACKVGPGETESIALCLLNDNYFLCCDDRKARKCAIAHITKNRVTGTIGLLQRMTANDILECLEAQENYTLMRNKGAFLPDIDLGILC
ncbi:MAG: hypothetical protein M3Y54_12590 [Bacteroidota bacterium]|nr:hypothetical protein [Bacteroidota bacterium]